MMTLKGRQMLRTIGLCAVTVLLFGMTAFGEEQSLEGSRPNIILVLTDDQGMGDLSCTGNTILKTPHIDAIYEKATRFTDFQVSPTCAPTRAAIMSGRFPFEVGVSHTLMQRERLAPKVVTFPQALQKAGYKTALFGKWHLGDDGEYLPQNRGFDEVLMHGAGGIGQYSFGDFEANADNKYFDNVFLHNDTVVKTKGFCTDVFFQAALSWMKQQSSTDDPFFAYISLNAPHGPLHCPQKYLDLYKDQKNNIAAFFGMITNIDENFQRLRGFLKEQELEHQCQSLLFSIFVLLSSSSLLFYFILLYSTSFLLFLLLLFFYFVLYFFYSISFYSLLSLLLLLFPLRLKALEGKGRRREDLRMAHSQPGKSNNHLPPTGAGPSQDRPDEADQS